MTNIKYIDICEGYQEELDFLKYLVKSYEENYIDFKKMLESVFKDKIHFPPNDEFTIEYKVDLRYGKNFSEISLKKAKEDLTNFRIFLNTGWFQNEFFYKHNDYK
jgi:hypothetical protein